METLEQAKKNLLLIADKIQPFAPIKRKPWLSLGCAFASGILFSMFQKSTKGLSILPLLLDGADLAIKSLLERKK